MTNKINCLPIDDKILIKLVCMCALLFTLKDDERTGANKYKQENAEQNNYLPEHFAKGSVQPYQSIECYACISVDQLSVEQAIIGPICSPIG